VQRYVGVFSGAEFHRELFDLNAVVRARGRILAGWSQHALGFGGVYESTWTATEHYQSCSDLNRSSVHLQLLTPKSSRHEEGFLLNEDTFRF